MRTLVLTTLFATLSFGANIEPQAPTSTDLLVGINRSTILENAAGVKRISIANSDVAEAVAVSRTEVLVNGKAQGDTSLVLWDQNDRKTMFDVHVSADTSKLEAAKAELQREVPGQNVALKFSGGSVFLTGTVDDLTAADRAAAIAATVGKVVNLLHVKVPQAEPQILLKVRFANVERAALQQLGANLMSTGATNTIGTISTGQFGQQPTFDFTQDPFKVTFNDLLNIFFFRRDLNLAGTIQALANKQLVQILAEPNLLTVSGKPASFLAGGEFPYPTLQGGAAGIGQITIQFREFGIRLHFLPTVTPRGTIRLAVTPEVSSLDFANGLTVSGYTVPGLATRRVQTEVELENGQSFAIAGLLDNTTTENLEKIPGLSSIPVLGKLFESRSLQKNNSELMVLVTPVLVAPIPAGANTPQVKMPQKFLKDSAPAAPQNPALSTSDPATKLPKSDTLPVEVIRSWTQPPSGDSNNTGAEPRPQASGLTPPN
jgi:pilus assembly protein CpaC